MSVCLMSDVVMGIDQDLNTSPRYGCGDAAVESTEDLASTVTVLPD